jgi:biopolymer transport protein TolR
MKFALLTLWSLSSLSAVFAYDSAQPPVLCPEEVLPLAPGQTGSQVEKCLDLSAVKDPLSDFPVGLSAEEIQLWKTRDRLELSYCRSVELAKRGDAGTSQYGAGTTQLAWMRAKAVEGRDEKIRLISEASEREGVPAQIIVGAFSAESLFANLGIVEDGGNYSCGMGQVNLSEWCQWIRSQSDFMKVSLGWPLVDVMLVLLIVFMVSAPLMQQGVQVDLPKANSGSLTETPEQILVTIDKSTKLRINNEEIPSGQLRKRLEALSKGKPDIQVFVQADKSISYGLVAEVMAEVKNAKIQRVGLVTIPGDPNKRL